MGGLKTYEAVGHLYSQSQECSVGASRLNIDGMYFLVHRM